MVGLKIGTSLWVLIFQIVLASSAINIKSRLVRQNNGIPFNCKDKPRISRFADPSDCTRFIYCISGDPHPAKCHPPGSRFNPATTRCDLPASVSCGSNVETSSKPPNVQQTLKPNPTTTQSNLTPQSPITNSHTEIPTKTTMKNDDLMIIMPEITQNPSTSTIVPQRTTVTPKPAILNDNFNFQLDCTMLPCGLYPNHNGNCSTFIMCSNGLKTTKHCNGGQLFDTKTSECQEPSEATCWKEPDSGPFAGKSIPPKTCSFHDKPHANSFKNSTNGIVLSNPVVTNWGSWLPWTSCPNGTYVNGINAWRRLLKSGTNSDHAGLVSLALNCERPDGSGKSFIESLAPGAPNDGWPNFYTCKGSGIGFRLNSHRDVGPWPNDNLGTDNVQIICSCGPPAYKPYENIPGEQIGNRGDWTQEQICLPRQAICSIQTQMADYRERVIGQYDNTGLNNMNVKCCDVPNPAKICKPKEKTVLLRRCENTIGIYPRRCDFEVSVGVTYDFASNLQSINFYESIGFSISNSTAELRENFAQNLPSDGMDYEYSWGESDNIIWNEAKLTSEESRSIYLQANTIVDLYQIVGVCSHFIVKTNRFIRNVTLLSDGTRTKEYFEV